MHGVIFPFGGTSAPAGFLMCDGSAVSRAAYPLLFATIGTAFGNGDGSTTFNVPDLRGRVPAGKDDMGGSAANRLTNGGSGVAGNTLGAVGGAETHTLSASQIPPHTHPLPAAGAGTGAGSNAQLYQGTNTGNINTSANTGGGAAHNNTQPTMVLNYIIKT